MMKKQVAARILLMLIMSFPFCVLAATGGQTTTLVTPQQKEVLDLFKWVVGIALSGQLFWIMRYMKENDKKHDNHATERKEAAKENHKTHDKQWEAIGNLAKNLAHLNGSHEANVGLHQRHGDEDVYPHVRLPLDEGEHKAIDEKG